VGAISPELKIDLFQAADQINHFTSLDRAPGESAKMSAATERSGFIDQTFSRADLEHGAGPIGWIG
jgi:hypothetical protein